MPEGLNEPNDPSSDLDWVFIALLRMDANSNSAVELSEYLRRAQTNAEPITGDHDEVERFKYLSCKPQADGGEYGNCGISYDRADLRQTMYMLEDVNHIIDAANPTNEGRNTAYEVFINKEFRHRDYNSDGQITLEEHDRHREHKEVVREGYERLVDTTPDEQISRATYVALGDGHPVLNHLDANEAFTIMDTNYDQMLSFDELWDVIQIDDIIWSRFD